jgi:uncharacterized membrane protein
MDFSGIRRKHQGALLMAVSMLTYVVVLSAYTISKHNSFSTYAWDLGIFNQGFWTTVNLDRVFYYTCELHLVPSGSFFGIHFSPILYTLVPFYYLFQGAEALLVAQSILIALSAIPVYLIARTWFDEGYSGLLASLYLLNPALHGVNCYDFHVQAFLPLILGYLLYFTMKKNWGGILISANLAMAVQEQVLYIVLAFAGYLLVKPLIEREKEGGALRSMLPGIALVLISVVAWRLLSVTVISYFNPVIPDHLLAGQHFAVLGVDAPLKIPLHVLRNPGAVIRALTYEWYNKVVYILGLFAPVIFLVLQSPQYLIPTLPWFAISLLSNYPPYYRIGFQYSAYVIPFIYASMIAGFGKVSQTSNGSNLRRSMTILTVALVASSLAVSPLSPLTMGFYMSPAYQKPGQTTRTDIVHDMVSMIPPESTVMTQDNLFPHLSSRENAYVMVPSTFKDVATWKNAIGWITSLETEYILIDMETDPHDTVKFLLDIVKRGEYGLVSFHDNVYLYRRGYETNPVSYEPINITYTSIELIPQNMKVVTDKTGNTGRVLAYVNTSIRSRTLWYGPYQILPTGEYQASFRVKTLDPGAGGYITVDAYANRTVLGSTTFTESTLKIGEWTEVKLRFSLTEVVYDLELRGFLVTQNTTIRLDWINLTQEP